MISLHRLHKCYLLNINIYSQNQYIVYTNILPNDGIVFDMTKYKSENVSITMNYYGIQNNYS